MSGFSDMTVEQLLDHYACQRGRRDQAQYIDNWHDCQAEQSAADAQMAAVQAEIKRRIGGKQEAA